MSRNDNNERVSTGVFGLCSEANIPFLTSIGPRIANIFAEYNQQDATFLNLFISVGHCMFQTGFQSIISSSKLHIQCQVFVRPLLLSSASLARLATGSGNGLTLYVQF